MAKAYKYKGVLAQPIGSNHWLVAALSERGPRGDPNARQWAMDIERKKLTERLLALCDDLGISRNDPDPWPKLALALAERHVDGFSRETLKQRGPKSDVSRHAQLAHLVDERIAGGQKVSPAVRAVAKQLKVKSFATAERDYRRFKAWQAKVREMSTPRWQAMKKKEAAPIPGKVRR